MSLGQLLAALSLNNVTLASLITNQVWGKEKLEAGYSLLLVLTALVCGVLIVALIGGVSRDLTGSYYLGYM